MQEVPATMYVLGAGCFSRTFVSRPPDTYSITLSRFVPSFADPCAQWASSRYVWVYLVNSDLHPLCLFDKKQPLQSDSDSTVQTG